MNIHKAALASLLAFGIAVPAFAQTASGADTQEQTMQSGQAAAKSDHKTAAKERHQTKHTAKRDGTKAAKTAKAKHEKTNPNPPAAQ
jgi:hypothetical protein